jgi:hypothetical protein
MDKTAKALKKLAVDKSATVNIRVAVGWPQDRTLVNVPNNRGSHEQTGVY